MNRPKVLLVEWVDSGGRSGWCGGDELAIPIMVCETAGYLVSETGDVLTLALNRTITEGCKPFGELMAIPKRAITKRKVLRA